jgi:gas vesicle protein
MLKNLVNHPSVMWWQSFLMSWGCVPELSKDCQDMTNASSAYLGVVVGAIIGGLISWLIYNRQKHTSNKQDQTLKNIESINEFQDSTLEKIKEINKDQDEMLKRLDASDKRHDKMLETIMALGKRIEYIVEGQENLRVSLRKDKDTAL